MGEIDPPNLPATPPAPAGPRRIGLIAGWGDYPRVVASALQQAGCHVYCLGLRGHAGPDLAQCCHDFSWVGLARLGASIRYFKRHRVTEAVMAGKIHKTVLFQPWRWLRNLPDLRMLKAAVPHFLTRRKDCRDDSLLNMLVHEFERDGIRIGRATDFAPRLLVQPGPLTSRSPSPWQWKDIAFGWSIAKQMGGLDIGQTVAVKDLAVLAVEAIEGTDECIRRAGALCPARKFTVVKVAKPRQDMRFDVPTVGLGTLRTIVESGGRVLAIEARKTIVLDQPQFTEFADRHRLVVVALEEPPPSAPAASDTAAQAEPSRPAPQADRPRESGKR